MEEKEIDLIIEDEKENKYIFEVPRRIKCKDLKEIILKAKIVKNSKFHIIYKNKKYEEKEEDLNQILHLSQGDRIYIESYVSLESGFECNFHKNVNLNEADMNYIVELSGILLLCLLKYIAQNLNINDLSKINQKEIREVIQELSEGIKMTGNPQKDIKESLSQKNGNNILTYINYLNEIITTKVIWTLIFLFDENKQNEIINLWSILSKYQDFNILFEKDFSKIIEQSYFDYSLIGVSLYQHRRRKEFVKNLRECGNVEVRYLLHGTQIDPISLIITDDFKYTKKAFYGMGIYFSDMIDYISFYCGDYSKGKRENWKKIIPVGETISCIATEVYYDKDKKKYVYDNRYYVPTLKDFPTYEEIQTKYKDKKVEKDGVHFVRVEPTHGHVLKSENDVENAIKAGKFVGTEYVITEMKQILPLYGLTLKRNEYFVIWRDQNFKGENYWTKYLKGRKMFIYKEAKMNVFFESCTEKALEIIKRKKYNKIIIITSCQGELVGRKFVDIVRKILGFDVVVLFFSEGTKHLKWIQNYPNALYTNNEYFYKKYLTSYNIEGLFQLKQEMEQKYGYPLNLNKNCLDYPKFVEKKNYDELLFEEVCPYFRKVIIKNKFYKKALFMKEGIPKFEDYDGKDIKELIWFITIINGEITLFSNDFYLNVNNNIQVIGSEFMNNWKYEEINSKYLLFFQNKNYVLSLDGDNVVLEKENISKNNQLFQLFDINQN